MYVVLVEIRIKPGFERQATDQLLENARASLESEAGCHQFDVCTTIQDPTLFTLYEIYDDRAAFDAHLSSEHYKSFQSASEDYIEHKNVRYLMRLDPAA